MRCNIIGAGRLGKNIAYALSTAQIIDLRYVCNRHLDNAIQACQSIGYGTPISSLTELPQVDITWITCNDDSIESIVTFLTQYPILKPESIVVHCSGVLSSSLLAPLRSQGCSIASFHPLKSFRTGYLDANVFRQVDCVLEGDSKAIDWLSHSFSQIGAQLININEDAKIIYHAAATIASNYLVTLAATSEELLIKAGIPPVQSKNMICKLMQGTIDNLKQTQHIADSLTGPLMRGDLKTLELHLNELQNPTLAKLYKAAGLATIPLCRLTKDQVQNIKNLFEKE